MMLALLDMLSLLKPKDLIEIFAVPDCGKDW
jgi:hypothetical protein